MSHSKHSPQKVTAAQRLAKAVEMRKAGASYGAIASSLGYASESGAFHAVNRALKKLNSKIVEDLAELRRLEVERLDRLLVSIWPKAIRGHLGSLDRALRISERRSKILGLDAATKEEHKVTATLSLNKPPSDPKEAQAYLDRVLGSRHTRT